MESTLSEEWDDVEQFLNDVTFSPIASNFDIASYDLPSPPLSESEAVSFIETIPNYNEIDEEPVITHNYLRFIIPVASGLRFRYQSEIDKRSFSYLKGPKNLAPEVEICSPVMDPVLMVSLVTEMEDAHFNMLYEAPRDKNKTMTISNGHCFIPMKLNAYQLARVKLDCLGIMKMKLKEALPIIKKLHPRKTEAEAKSFFHKCKDTVLVKVTILDKLGQRIWQIMSSPVKSQSSKENTEVKIMYMAPKYIVDNGENLIVILQKKITNINNVKSYMVIGTSQTELQPIQNDGQTFVFTLHSIRPESSSDSFISRAEFQMVCDDYSDSKPIMFLLREPEQRKRKLDHLPNQPPLKKLASPSNYSYQSTASFSTAETESHPFGSHIESDSAGISSPPTVQQNYVCSGRDSGVGSSSVQNRSEKGDEVLSDSHSINDSESDEDNYEDSEDGDIQVEGLRGRRKKIEMLQDVIVLPPKERPLKSKIDYSHKDPSTQKILSEVARIGHDYAFGRGAEQIIDRIEKQLPVVFTLQDDVGDTPLNNAILKGNVAQAERILDIVRRDCPWALNLVNTSGHSALILAPACTVPASFIQKLLDSNCNMSLYDDLDKSAITYAIEYKNLPALEVLVEYARKRNFRSMFQRTNRAYYSPLQVAVINNFYEAVVLFLRLRSSDDQYLVDVNEPGLMQGETALHLAVTNYVGRAIVDALLQREDIDINAEYSDKVTPLHLAIQTNQEDVVAILRDKGAEDKSIMEVDNDHISSDEDTENEELSPSGTISSTDCPAAVKNANIPVSEIIKKEQRAKIAGNNGSTMANLTKTMENLSLKGNVKSQMMSLLLGDGASSNNCALTVSEIYQIVKPNFRSLFSNNDDRTEMRDLLDRFNCLPNSVGQLLEKLRSIGREDLVAKIITTLHDSGR